MSVRVQVQSPRGLTEHDFDEPEVSIGRAATSGVVVPGTTVSRQHARLVRRDEAWWVEDLGTRFGTFLNDKPLTSPALLLPGDRVRVGETVLHFVGDSRDGAPVAPATGPADDRDTARMRTLNDIHRALAEPISLPELLDRILERSFEVLRPEEGAILLRGRDGEFSTAASRRLDGGTDVVVPRRLVDEVARKVRPALVLDAPMDERFASSESMAISGIRSFVAAPLADAEGAIGLITLCSRVHVRAFTPPDLDMLVSIASAAALRVRNVALSDEAAARRVLEHELSLAHDMQMAMLPRRVPERAEIALAASLKPARSVGGDLYDFVLDGDQLWFIVADVAGKSVAAALYMAVVKTLFRATLRGASDLPAVIGRMNDELASDNDRMMFVTAAAGCLDLASGRVTIVDAGHNPVVRIACDGRLSAPQVPKGVALGVVEDFSYVAATLTLEPGEALVLYTDGMTDARSTSGEMFGADRLERAISAAARHAPQALVASVLQSVEAFAVGAPPEDDLTMLALRYLGGSRRG